MFLTDTELEALTNRSRHDAQVRALRFMCIEHKVRADGSVAVLRSHVEHLLGGTAPAKMNKTEEPDWSSLAKTPQT